MSVCVHARARVFVVHYTYVFLYIYTHNLKVRYFDFSLEILGGPFWTEIDVSLIIEIKTNRLGNGRSADRPDAYRIQLRRRFPSALNFGRYGVKPSATAPVGRRHTQRYSTIALCRTTISHTVAANHIFRKTAAVARVSRGSINQMNSCAFALKQHFPVSITRRKCDFRCCFFCINTTVICVCESCVYDV